MHSCTHPATLNLDDLLSTGSCMPSACHALYMLLFVCLIVKLLLMVVSAFGRHIIKNLLPYYICLPSLKLIVRAIFLSGCRHTQSQLLTLPTLRPLQAWVNNINNNINRQRLSRCVMFMKKMNCRCKGLVAVLTATVVVFWKVHADFAVMLTV